MFKVKPDHGQDDGPLGRLLGSISEALASLLAVGHTRFELLTIELQLELRWVARMLVVGSVALLAAGLGVLMLGLAIIFAYWDTHRVLAAALVTVAFFVIASLAALALQRKLRHKPPALQGTLAELAKDQDMLRRRRGGPHSAATQ